MRVRFQNIHWVPTLLVAGLLLLLVGILVARAWVGDDVFITMRVADQFVHGFGPNYNQGERVQAYTHPLWMLLLTGGYALWRDAYGVPLALSLGVSLAALGFAVWRVARSATGAVLGLLALAFSAAFVDFSSSGLENPLNHLLAAVFVALLLRGQTWRRLPVCLALVAALSFLNRADTVLLYAPALWVVFWGRRGWNTLLQMALGLLPVLLWEGFSLFYYGFPFPNTYYAKLTAAIAPTDLMAQGMRYLDYSLQHDPVSILLLWVGVVLPFLPGQRRWVALALGNALYLAYVVAIGGDFMAGRFLTLSIFVSALWMMQFDFQHLPRPALAMCVLLVVGLGLNAPSSTLRLGMDLKAPRPIENGIADERLFYLENSLFNLQPGASQPLHPWAKEGRLAAQSSQPVLVLGPAGMIGFYAGAGKQVIDRYALADALLAHLPPLRTPTWRPGHLLRALPPGYLETRQTLVNRIEDVELAQYYDVLQLIIRGRLLDPQRLAAIVRMNLGFYNPLIVTERFIYAGELVKTPAAAATLTAPGGLALPTMGLRIDFPQEQHSAWLEVNVDAGGSYLLAYFRGNERVAEQPLVQPGSGVGLQTRLVEVPAQARQAGFDRLRLLPAQGKTFVFGFLRVVE